MFFGTGAIHQGIEFFHREIHGLGLRGEISSGFTLARFLLALILGNRERVRPVSIRVGLDQGPAEQREFIALLVSSLERLIVGLRPFFGAGEGPLHFTALATRPKYLLRVVPLLVRGRQSRYGTPEHGYFSANVNEVELGLETGFTLDGELYAPDPRRGPLAVTTGGWASFLRL
jgi:hypothetical protein